MKTGVTATPLAVVVNRLGTGQAMFVSGSHAPVFNPVRTVETHLMGNSMLRISLAFVLGVVVASTLTGADKKSEWQPLTDGKTLKNWHAVGDGTWTVEDGVIVGRANNEKLYGLLVSDNVFSDFTVRFKFKCLAGDSGFYIRTIIKEPDQAHGLQVQVGLPGSGAGGIYESYGRGWLDKLTKEREAEILKKDDWNEMKIVADGPHVVVHVNGVKTAELHDEKSRPEGHFALQMHSGDVMHVMFKDIEILQSHGG